MGQAARTSECCRRSRQVGRNGNLSGLPSIAFVRHSRRRSRIRVVDKPFRSLDGDQSVASSRYRHFRLRVLNSDGGHNTGVRSAPSDLRTRGGHDDYRSGLDQTVGGGHSARRAISPRSAAGTVPSSRGRPPATASRSSRRSRRAARTWFAPTESRSRRRSQASPDVLAPLRLHYLRWVLFDVGSGLHFQYQGIFDTDFDKYTEDAVQLFSATGITTVFTNLEGSPRIGRRTRRRSSRSSATTRCPASSSTANTRTSPPTRSRRRCG